MAVIALAAGSLRAQTAPSTNPNAPSPTSVEYPFRTDFSGANLPWYKLQSGVFPPLHSEHRVRGQLVDADFIHRKGQFRSNETGDLVPFTLRPYAVVLYHGTQADLRDIPIETELTFFTYQDSAGAFTQVAALQDDFTLEQREGNVLHLESIAPQPDQAGARKLIVWAQPASAAATSQASSQPFAPSGAPRQELIATDATRIWKGDQPARLDDLQPGQALLINRGTPRHACTEIFIGADSVRAATDRERKIHTKFIADRGVAAWIDRVEGKRIVVTIFGDAADEAQFFKEQDIDPVRYVKEQKRLHTVVANEELRSYNPPVDGQGSNVLHYEALPTDNYGCSGVQWTLEPGLMLEGFRRGRIVRIFANQSWPHEDMPYGEKLYDEGDQHLAEQAPNQFPFRTDFGNEDLPWFTYTPGALVPWGAEHSLHGELLWADPSHRVGRFRADVTGEVVNFTLLPTATVRYLNADSELADLPIGTRYDFSMLRDASGNFTRAIQITDDFTRLVESPALRRVESLGDESDPFVLITHLPMRKDDKDHDVLPPDLQHGEFGFNSQTSIIKGAQQLSMKDLSPGDDMLMNQSGATTRSRGIVTAAWIGPVAQKAATERQRAKHTDYLRQEGMLAMVEAVSPTTLTLNFIAADRREFAGVLNGDPWGRPLLVFRTDEGLKHIGSEPLRFAIKEHTRELNTYNTFGASGIRWVLELNPMPADLKPGQMLRIFKDDWKLPTAATTTPAR